MSPYKILVSQPSGGNVMEVAINASIYFSRRHAVDRASSWKSGPNFNQCWVNALNAGEAGLYTHHGMAHADIAVIEEDPLLRCGDVLIEEMEKVGAVFISVPIAIKNGSGVTSSGIGWEQPWNPWRRFTVPELKEFPETFTAEDLGYGGDKFLLHNHALCVWDMRWPGWYEANPDGTAKACFNFVETIRRFEGLWRRDQESEDWYFSRRLWELGAKTAITSKVKVQHFGLIAFNNWDSGEYAWKNGDEATASQWRPAPELRKRRVS